MSAAAMFALSFFIILQLVLARPGFSGTNNLRLVHASTTAPSIVVPPEVVAHSDNLTIPVFSTAVLRFKYQHPEVKEEGHILVKTVHAVHSGRRDFCELIEQVPKCHGEFQGRAVLKDNEEEGELTLTLFGVLHTDEGWYEAEVRVFYHPHGKAANANTYLHVIDKPGCPALMCPGSNVSICRVENISTAMQPQGLLTCSCECTELWKPAATGSSVSALGYVVLGMLLIAALLCVLFVVSIIKGWVVLHRSTSMARDGLICDVCPAREVTQGVDFYDE